MVKKMLKAFTVAFSVYSKIPMPGFIWESEDMQYSMAFFPFVGTLIGTLEWCWFTLAFSCHFPDLLRVTFAVAIPLIVTGGIHIDGFMDTCDALNSYQPREKKLEILKDPHIGAFAVICLCTYMLVACGFISLVTNMSAVAVIGLNCFMARAFSGLGVQIFPSAKKDGMLHSFSENSAKKVVVTLLTIELALCLLIGIYIDWQLMCIAALTDLLTFLYYGKMSKKHFGGITGDLAGWFLSMAELLAVVIVSIAQYCM